jgi:hypothetical protein
MYLRTFAILSLSLAACSKDSPPVASAAPTTVLPTATVAVAPASPPTANVDPSALASVANTTTAPTSSAVPTPKTPAISADFAGDKYKWNVRFEPLLSNDGKRVIYVVSGQQQDGGRGYPNDTAFVRTTNGDKLEKHYPLIVANDIDASEKNLPAFQKRVEANVATVRKIIEAEPFTVMTGVKGVPEGKPAMVGDLTVELKEMRLTVLKGDKKLVDMDVKSWKGKDKPLSPGGLVCTFVPKLEAAYAVPGKNTLLVIVHHAPLGGVDFCMWPDEGHVVTWK